MSRQKHPASAASEQHDRAALDERTMDAATRVPASNQEDRIRESLRTITHVAQQPVGSPSRAHAITMAAETLEVCERTVRRRVERYEEHGDQGLARKRPSNAGEPRVILSRDLDRLIGDEAIATALAAKLDEVIPALWQSRAYQCGERRIADLAAKALFLHARDLGLSFDLAAIKIPRHRVRLYEHHKIVGVHDFDRKAYADNEPRIRRSVARMKPNDVLIIDVKPTDVLCRREDGTPAFPKLISLHDVATGHTTGDLVLLSQSEGVRQEHVNNAFIRRVTEFGLPKRILVDNGSENKALDMLREPLANLSRSGTKVISRALPYRPQSKRIEGWFGDFLDERLKLVPGYVGPNRMMKKVETVGKPPNPFPGDFQKLRRIVAGLIDDANGSPVGGERAGKSPNQIMQEKIDTGWRPTYIDPFVLEAAFCKVIKRTIKRGSISVGGVFFTHRLIQGCPHKKIEVAQHWRVGEAPLFRLPGEKAWTLAEKDVARDYLDTAGARDGDARRAERKKTVSNLRASVKAVDPLAMILAIVPNAPELPEYGARVLDAGAAIHDLADALKNHPTPAPAETARVMREAELAAEHAQLESLIGPIELPKRRVNAY